MNSSQTCELEFINGVNKVNIDFVIIFPIHFIFTKICGFINCKSHFNQFHFIKPKNLYYFKNQFHIIILTKHVQIITNSSHKHLFAHL